MLDRRLAALAAILAAPLVLAAQACGGGGCSVEFPEAPSGPVVYAAAGCNPEGADGTKEHPYTSLQAAIDAAAPGAAVVAAPGIYPENVSITKTVTVVGSSDASDAEKAGIIIQAPEPNAVTVAATGVVLRGVSVQAARGVGIWIQGGDATVEGSKIDGTLLEGGAFGYGILASDDASIIIQHSSIGTSPVGVLVSGAKGIIIQNTLSENGTGVRLDGASGDVQVEANTIADSGDFGVLSLGSKAIIIQNEVLRSGSASSLQGDGIVASHLDTGSAIVPGDASIQGNTVTDSRRVGVLVNGDTKGIIIQNTLDGNAFGANEGAGIWIQNGAGTDAPIEVSSNTLTGNRFMAVGVTLNARAIIIQNVAISGTTLGQVQGLVDGMPSTYDVGDGIGVFDGASASIQSNAIGANGRFGIAFDAADGASCDVSDNDIADNDQYGIIIQNQAMPPMVGTNTFMGNALGDSLSLMPGDPSFGMMKLDAAF